MTIRAAMYRRETLLALGVVLLALPVWFAGEALAWNGHRPLASPWARALLVALLVALAAGAEALRRSRAARAQRRLLEALAEAGEGADAAAVARYEAAELRRRFAAALATLRRGSGEGRRLQQLPWYVFIGAPGSGKTTALQHSGLRFPLAGATGPEALPGVGGTRHCDWWFTDEAVLIDTAGRWTLQGSNPEVDAAAWQGFLGLLHQHRPRQPLNGVLVTLGVPELLDAAQRTATAQAVCARVEELHRALGLRLPLYVLLTKCDLLAGFAEFFADLGQEARAQVWGLTFDLAGADARAGGGADSFTARMQALLRRLDARLPERLQQERDAGRRARLFTFPRQFALLQGPLHAFLDEAFAPSAWREPPLLRGVYFSSGTQQGTPLDRVLAQQGRDWGLGAQAVPAPPASGRSYFLTRLLREVVFAERDLGAATAQGARRRRLAVWAVHGTLGTAALLLAGAWGISCTRNQRLVAEAAAAARDAAALAAALPGAVDGDVRAALPLLRALRALPAGPDSPAPGALSGLGLSQHPKLGAAARHAYDDALQAALLPRVSLRLQQRLREAPPEAQEAALKALLMLHDPRHRDAPALEDGLLSDPALAGTADVPALRTHLHAALALRDAAPLPAPDAALVEAARRRLAAVPLAERAQARLAQVASQALPPFRISDAAGPAAALVFTRASGQPLAEGLPGAYTARGWEAVVKPQAPAMLDTLAREEAWVLGPVAPPAAGAPALAALAQRHGQEAVRAWDALLADLRLVPAATLAQSIQQLALLSGPDSPLRRLLLAVAAQTRALPEEAARHFEPLRRAVEATAGGGAPLDAALVAAREYEVLLRAVDEAARRGVAAPGDGTALARLRSEAARLPAPLSALVGSLAERAGTQASGGAQAGLRQAVASEIGGYCRQAVEGRYPFAREPAREVPLGDFAQLFAPGGRFDLFARHRLGAAGGVGAIAVAASPVPGGTADTAPPGAFEGPVALAPAQAAAFQRAAVIRDAFFPAGAAQPAVTAELVLLRLDDGLAEVQLSVGGQTWRLQPGGAVSAVRLNWPATDAGAAVRLAGTTSAHGDTPALRFEGPWALFRLLDAARVEGGPPERLRLSFALGEQRAWFELRASSVHNPLRLPELAQFRCPA